MTLGGTAWRRLPGVPGGAPATPIRTSLSGGLALAQGCTPLWDGDAGRWSGSSPRACRGVGRIVAAGPVFLIAGAGHGRAATAWSPTGPAPDTGDGAAG